MDAIRKDATQEAAEAQAVAEPRVKTSRDEALALITARRDEELKDELAPVELDPDAPDPDPVTDPEPDEKDLPVKDEVPVADGDMLVKVKVDGVEATLPLHEVLKGFQKDATASKRLEAISKQQRELDARAADVAEREAALQRGAPAKKADDPPPANAAAVKDVVEEVVSALFTGDEQKSKEALTKILEGRANGATPLVDPAQFRAQVLTELKTELAFETALAKFDEDYKDIVSDPVLAGIADQILDAELQKGVSIKTAFKTAGTETRKWLESKAPKPPTENEREQQKREDKAARKAQIDNLPSANAKAVTLEDKPQTPSQTIAEMRKARGLPV